MMGTSNDMKFNWLKNKNKKNNPKAFQGSTHVLQILYVSMCLSLQTETDKLHVSQTDLKSCWWPSNSHVVVTQDNHYLSLRSGLVKMQNGK